VSSSLRRAAVDAGLSIEHFAEPDSRHVVVDGHRTHYLDWGNEDRPTVVFLHGHGLTAHTWDLVALALRPHVHCLSVDLRGHGDSEWSPGADYRMPAFVNDSVGFVKQVADGPVVVVGQSLGGIIALRTAIEEPDSVRGVVVLDIAPDSERRFRQPVEEADERSTAKRLAQLRSLPAELDSVEAFVQQALAFNPRRNAESLRASLRHNLRQLPNGKWSWKYDTRTFSGRPPEPLIPDYWNEMDQVKCPTLIVRGGRSDILTEEGAQELVAMLPNARWDTVADAGHSVQGDNPAGLVEVLTTFFDELGVPC
jgi:esterase